MTEVSGGVTGISRAHGGVKMGSCNQLVSNVRLQVSRAWVDNLSNAEDVNSAKIKIFSDNLNIVGHPWPSMAIFAFEEFR